MASKAETDFINEFTRTRLVKWCAYYLKHGDLPASEQEGVFWEHAMAKGWVSKKDGRILSTGFKTAASFLRR
jgi:hypothetical protein